MKKSIVLVLPAIVVIVLAFVAGVLVQREYQLAPIRLAEDFARQLAGLDDAVPPAPSWETWPYPGAKSKGSLQGPSLRVAGQLVRPSAQYALLVTTDSFEDVARFYAERANFDDAEVVANSQFAISSQGTLHGESNHVLDDFIDAADPQTVRPVRVKCLVRRCPSYDLTILITRADGESHTHVVLLYEPKTEAEVPAP